VSKPSDLLSHQLTKISKVPSYQPEMAYEIFMRAITNRDIATGTINLNEYASTHEEQYAMKSDRLPQPPHECYLLDIEGRCTDEEAAWILDGTAVVKDWILVGRNQSVVENDDGEEEQTLPYLSGQHPLLGDW
jgi:hypothetical protein